MAFAVACELAELQEGCAKGVVLRGQWVCLIRQGEAVYAIEDRCTHANVALAGGAVEGDKIICPRHLAEFNFKTGAALCFPAKCAVPTYPTQVIDGRVEVDLPV